MAEPVESSGSLMGTFKQKLGPLPLGVWIIMVAVVGGYIWYRHNQSSQSSATSAAAGQTNSNLGSADQLANAFTTAGDMPYSGGDTYINSVGTGTIGSSPAAPTVPQTVNVAAGQDMGQIVNMIRAKIDPNFNWTDLWSLNPHLAQSMRQDPKTKYWYTTKPVTITISKPGLVDLPKTPIGAPKNA